MGDGPDSPTPVTGPDEVICRLTHETVLSSLMLRRRTSRSVCAMAQDWSWRAWYRLVSRLDRNSELTFLNYGYQGAETPLLPPREESDRYSIQLYREVARAIPGNPSEMRFLEVGCGRGGGLAHLATWLRPEHMIGVDICEPAIEFCRRKHPGKNISFLHGAASCLPVDGGEIDAILNIESSHRYPDMNRFLREVRRVMRRPGYLSFADFRPRDGLEELRGAFTDAGLEITLETDITPGVVRALDLDDNRKRQLIGRIVPRPLRRIAGEFAAVVGSRSYRSMANGRRAYVHVLLRIE